MKKIIGLLIGMLLMTITGISQNNTAKWFYFVPYDTTTNLFTIKNGITYYNSATNKFTYYENGHYKKWGSGSGGGGTWGSITGTLSSQSDLQTALNGKQSTISFGSGVLTALGIATNVGSGIVVKDANSNIFVNQVFTNYTTTATAAGTTTLNITSTPQQYFTGSTTQTVLLPLVTTLNLGAQYLFTNLSSGVVTVQSSGGNTIQAMAQNSFLTVTCILTTGTTAASWSFNYEPNISGTPLPVANGGTNASSAGITAFNNITGYSASGATGTTSSNLVFSASPALTGNPTVPTQSAGTNNTTASSTAFVTTAINNAIAGVNPAVAVQAATTANVAGYTYNNGVSGVGATLTQNSAAIVVIDGYTLLLNDRVLFKNQSTAANNGIYFISTLGTGIIPAVFTRALDYDQPSDMNNTGSIPVVNGTANTLTSWLQTSTVTTVGTDAVTFTQFSYNPTAIPAANISSGALANGMTATTQNINDNSTKIATTTYVDRSLTIQTLTDASTITWNVSNGINSTVTLGATGRTLSITNPVAGQVYIIVIVQDGSGSRTITTWPTGTKWMTGTAPTLSTAAAAIDMVSFYYNGTNYFGTYSTGFN